MSTKHGLICFLSQCRPILDEDKQLDCIMDIIFPSTDEDEASAEDADPAVDAAPAEEAAF